MLELCRLERQRVNLDLPKIIVDKIDEYRTSLANPVVRNHILREACLEYLRARGIEVMITDTES